MGGVWAARPAGVGDLPAGARDRLEPLLADGGWIWIHPGWRTDLVEALAPLPGVPLDEPPAAAGVPAGTLVLLTRPDSREARELALRLERRSTARRLPDEGPWQVWRLTRPYAAGRPRTMAAKVARLRVHRTGEDGRSDDCPWVGLTRRHQCPGPAWNNVRKTKQRADGERRTCLWVHPVRGATMVLRWRPGRRVSYAQLVAGFSDHAARSRAGAPAHIAVRWGDTPAGELAVPNRRGWRRLDLDGRPPSEPAGAPLVLEISLGPGSPGARHLCLDVEVEQ